QLQIYSLEAQIARDEAQLNSRPLSFPDRTDPDFRKYVGIQTDLYNQQMAQYTAQISSYDAQIKQNQATILKYKTDEGGYQQRVDINKQIEDMRTTLAVSGSGSVLNKLLAQDQTAELTRSRNYDRNSLAEAEQTLQSTLANKDAYIQQWLGQLSQELAGA